MRRIADASIDGLDDMFARLTRISDQNQKPGEGLQVAATYANTAIEVLQDHVADPDAHG